MGASGAVQAVVGEAQPVAAHGVVRPRGHDGHMILVLDAGGDAPAGVFHPALHTEGLVNRGLTVQDADADREGIDFPLFREEAVTSKFRHVNEIAGRAIGFRDHPLGGNDDVSLPGEVKVVQGPMVFGQFPKTQVVLLGELIQIFVAHDVMGGGLAHHGDGAAFSTQGGDKSGPLIESGQPGRQVWGVAFLGRHFFEP